MKRDLGHRPILPSALFLLALILLMLGLLLASRCSQASVVATTVVDGK